MNDNYKQTEEPEMIKDPVAKKWYDFGFIFAVNYIYAVTDESDQADFKDFVDIRLGRDIIDEKYFEKYKFFEGQEAYPEGYCPGREPETCIPCLNNRITPIRRKP